MNILILTGVIAMGLIVTQDKLIKDLPHGIRINNPFNLIHTSIPWRGKIEPVGRFEAFNDPIFGLRAGLRDVWNDYRIDGKETIRELINEFAPPIENNTSAYVKSVSDFMGHGPDKPLNFPSQLALFARAIIRHENGASYVNYYSSDQLNIAINEAIL